jgi:phosphatidylglycerophosphate synthase
MAKLKTALQMLALALLLLNMCRIPFGLDGAQWAFIYDFGAVLTWVAAAMTIWTGLVYFLEARKTIWAHDIETHPH